MQWKNNKKYFYKKVNRIFDITWNIFYNIVDDKNYYLTILLWKLKI